MVRGVGPLVAVGSTVSMIALLPDLPLEAQTLGFRTDIQFWKESVFIKYNVHSRVGRSDHHFSLRYSRDTTSSTTARQ